MPRNPDPSTFLPVSPLDLQVLTLTAMRPLHGYAIVQAAGESFPGQPALDIGSLYRIISRMLNDRLLREVPPPDDAPDDRRTRHYYTATDLGKAVARAEADRLRALLASPAILRLRGSAR